MGQSTSKGTLAGVYSAYGVPTGVISPHEEDDLRKAAQNICNRLRYGTTGSGEGDTVQGGAETGIVGAGALQLSDLQQYGNSMYSSAKEKLIRDIAEHVFSALNHPAARGVQSASIDTIVEKLMDMLNKGGKPRKFGKDFNKSSGSQKHVIKALANAINSVYAGALIDTEGNENEMAEKVGEVVYSLIQGLHTEFMTVAGDAMRVMTNMQTVMNYMDAAYKKQRELIESTGDPRIRDQSANTDEVYTVIKGEYERQMAVLANLLNVSIGPTGKSLIASLENSRDFVGLVKDLRTAVGTQAFGDKLAYLLSGISTAAHSAALIDKALKKIGMSVADFKSASSAGELRSKIFRHIMKQSPNSRELDKMMAAAKVIVEANYDHNAVSKLLGKQGGNAMGGGAYGGADSDEEGMYGGADSDNDVVAVAGGDDGVMGGDDNLPLYWSKKSLQTKLKKKKEYRDLILKDFKQNIRNHYQNIVNAANQIAHRIGNGLVLSENLKSFVDAFALLDKIDNNTIHIALSGYPKDSENKERREKFMNKYKVVMLNCEVLAKESEGAAFKALGSAIHAMLLDIDNFSDKMVKAITEIHIDTPAEIANEIRKASNTFYGAADSNSASGSDSWVAFEKVRNELVYYYGIANVKINLARTNEDLKSYADDYEQILGEEAAWLIDRIKNNYLAKIELIKEEDVIIAAGGAPPLANNGGSNFSVQDIAQAQAVLTALRAAHAAGVAVPAVVPPAPNVASAPNHNHKIDNETKTAAQWALANLKTMWTYQMNAKVNMVKVAQAIDLYLKAFTDGITKNPDAIGSIVKMLNEVEIVAKWFNERSGDNLASLFEVFPMSPGNNAAAAGGAGAAAHNPVFASNVTYNGGVAEGKNRIVGADGAIKLLTTDGTHYYQYLEGRWHDGATVGPGAAGIRATPGDEWKVNTDHNYLPGNPFVGRPLFGNHTTPAQCKGILTLSKKVVTSMRALENIISTFASVGAKLGEVEPLTKTFMTPGQIFNHLCDYVAASAFTTEFAPEDAVTAAVYHGKTMVADLTYQPAAAAAVAVQTIPTNAAHALYRADLATPAAGGAANDWSQNLAEARNNAIMGVVAPGAITARTNGNNEIGILTGVTEVNIAAQAWRKFGSVALSAIPAEARGGINKWKYHDTNSQAIRYDLAGWRDSFFDTDHLFQMTIKSIVAKIFTVVDAYRLFHRPVVDRRSHYSLNPLRTILGGNDEKEGGATPTKVKVIPDALELYYRLVLLAEWYREHFGVETDGTAVLPPDNWRITLVPSIDGVWSELVEVIFDKAEYVKAGNYSETQVQRLITAINGIWSTYKSRYPKTTTRSILNAFVLEMNRAFGFLKQSDIDSYKKDRRTQYTQSAAGESEDLINYDILDAENQFGERPAPSDRFSKVSARATVRRERNMIFLQEAVENLRKHIDVEFLKVTQAMGNAGNAANHEVDHFQETLRNYRLDMNNSKSDVDEYKVVLRMLQGANKEVKVSTDKLVMVHETVAAPLVVIYAIYKVLARFNAFAHGASLVNVAKFNERRAALGGVNPHNLRGGVSAIMDNVYTAFDAYHAFIKGQYGDVAAANKNLVTAMFARAFTGAVPAVHGVATTDAAGAYQAAPIAGVHGYMKGAPAVVATPANTLLAGAVAAEMVQVDDIDAATLLQDILSALLDFGTNPHKLVTVAIGSNGNINLDFSALEDLVKELLNQVKDNVAKLRMSFAPNQVQQVLEKYENRNVVGSVRWLEEHLIQTIFNNRDKCGLPLALDHLQQTFARLCKPTTAAGGHANGPVGLPAEHYEGIDDAINGLVFYSNKAFALPYAAYPVDVTKFPGNIVPLKRELATTEDKEAVQQTSRLEAWNTAPSAVTAGGAGAAIARGTVLLNAANEVLQMPIISGTSDPNRFEINNAEHRSLMQALNNVLHMYLYVNVDENANKFYAPLIESFATSTASTEVIQGKAYPNIANYATAVNNPQANNTLAADSGVVTPKNNPAISGIRSMERVQAPPEGTVVYASNAIICRSLLTTTITSQTAIQKKKFLYDSLADAPEYMRERMRVNLPYFIKIFTMITDRAALLRQIMTNTDSLRNNLTSLAAALVPSPPNVRPDGCAPLYDLHRKTADQMAKYYDGLLTRIIDCARSLRKCADAVYKELQDRPPPFFEPNKDFLQEYRSMHGKLPVMPVSSILTPLRCMEGNPNEWRSTDMSHLLLPVKENGSMVYRFNYAARLVLGKSDLEVTIDHFPGAKDLYNGYATNAPRNSMISIADYSSTVLNMVKLSRFLIDGAVYGRLFNKPSRQLNFAAEPNRNIGPAPDAFDQGRINELYAVQDIYNSRNVFHAVNWRDGLDKDADSADVLRTVNRRQAAALVTVGGAVARQYVGDLTDDHIAAVAAAGGAGGGVARAAAIVAVAGYSSRVRNAAAGAGGAGGAVAAAITALGASPVNADAYLTAIAMAGEDADAVAVVGGAPAIGNAQGHSLVVGMATYPYKVEGVVAAGVAQKSLRVFQLCNTLNNIVDLTESANTATSKDNLVKSLNTELGGVTDHDRDKMRVLNILDAGIVPLNVHAFMREVPFVNLLNYSYTFDRMVHDFVLPSFVSQQVTNAAGRAAGGLVPGDLMIPHSNPLCNSTRELLVEMLVHPYTDLGAQSAKYFSILGSLFNGNDDLKLGRPRYLSDQLWHKVLLTSSAELVAGQERFDTMNATATNRYPNNMRPLEAGPAAYQAARSMMVHARTSLNTSSSMFENAAARAAGAPPVRFLVDGDPVSTSGLKYWDSTAGTAGTWTVANKVPAGATGAENMATGDVVYCAELGKMRFDTKLVRNLTWFVQLQRVMRVVLTNHLSWLTTPVVRGMKIADTKITEFNANDQYDDRDFTGENYEPM